MSQGIRRGLAALVLGAAAGCATAPPDDIDNVCAVFREKGGWYDDAMDAYERWGVPVHVQMAIIHQESSFRGDARPPRRRLFGFIPTTRPSSAYGYSQALDGTWDWYIKASGNGGADRDDFGDAADFVAWYGNVSHKRLGISKWDAYRQYLAYHEGHGGYARRTYARKGWLKQAARKVDSRAARYRQQLAACRDDLDRGGWWPF